MKYLLDLLILVGSLGLFIYGMKIMSEGLQKAAGEGMRKVLGVMTKNRFLGVLTGFIITAIIQSSSATTVMTVSFVNAGLLSVVESAGVMMGANIGTTITAWLISLLGFRVKIITIALPIIAIGFPLLFSRRSKTKALAEFLIGFSILFMGLEALSTSVPDLNKNPEVMAFLSEFANMGMLSIFLFIGIGTVLTIILQSSSATMALTLVMCYKGWLPYEAAAAMVLGENIGTTITAELAALIGNVHAKRSARIHSLFNIIGVSWMVWVMHFYLEAISFIIVKSGLPSPFTDPTSIPIALSYFHTAFNASNVILLIGPVKYLVALATFTIPSKGKTDEEFHLEFIEFGLSSTSELSIVEAKKEIDNFGKLSRKITALTPQLIFETDNKKFNNILKKIVKYEEISDRMEVEIADYLAKVSEGELGEKTILQVRSMIGIIADLERIADICFQMSKVIERKREGKIWFTPEQRENIRQMYRVVDHALEHMELNLKAGGSMEGLKKAQQLENEINEYRNTLRAEYHADLSKGIYTIQSGIIYHDIFSSLERIGDHVINVSEALVTEAQVVKA